MTRAALLLSILAFVPALQAAERLPLWEVGIGGGALQTPDYRGAGQSHTYPYPFIMPIYRGRYLKADEEGISGVLSASDRLRFDFSLYGNVPVGNDNDAREGMDDLDPLVEIGPMLRYKAWKGEAPRQSLILDTPVRAAFALGHGIDYVGYTIGPRLTYRRELDLLGQTWKWPISIEALWSSQGLNRYFYQVDPQYATATRPAYAADAGYAGTRFRTSIYRRDRNKLISLYAVYDSVQGAVFEDSPLVERDGGLTVGFLLMWFPFQSDELVEVKQWEWNTE